MSYRVKLLLTIIGMFFVFGYAAVNVTNGSADDLERPLPANLTNLAEAKLVEIKDASGQVVLSGNFTPAVAKPGDTELRAALTPTGVVPDATGLAEIEISKESNGAVEQEVEIEVERLAPLATYKVFIDGQEATSFATDSNGAADLELSSEAS